MPAMSAQVMFGEHVISWKCYETHTGPSGLSCRRSAVPCGSSCSTAARGDWLWVFHLLKWVTTDIMKEVKKRLQYRVKSATGRRPQRPSFQLHQAGRHAPFTEPTTVLRTLEPVFFWASCARCKRLEQLEYKVFFCLYLFVILSSSSAIKIKP